MLCLRYFQESHPVLHLALPSIHVWFIPTASEGGHSAQGKGILQAHPQPLPQARGWIPCLQKTLHECQRPGTAWLLPSIGPHEHWGAQMHQHLPLNVPISPCSYPGPGWSKLGPPECQLPVPPGVRTPACCRGRHRLPPAARLPLSSPPYNQGSYLESMGPPTAVLPVGRSPWRSLLLTRKPGSGCRFQRGELKIKPRKDVPAPLVLCRFTLLPGLPGTQHPTKERRGRKRRKTVYGGLLHYH